jgi:transcription antitermination factor NusG
VGCRAYRNGITRAPFRDFQGVVADPWPQPGKLRVEITFFSHKTTILLDSSDVELRQRPD